MVDRDGFLWYGTPGGIFKNFGDTRHFIPLQLRENDLSSWIFDIFQDKEGNIWVGCDIGAYKIDPYSYEKQLYEWKPKESRVDLGVRSFTEKPDGSIWFGTNWGHVVRLDESDSTVIYRNDAIVGNKRLDLSITSDERTIVRDSSSIYEIDNDSLKLIKVLAEESSFLPRSIYSEVVSELDESGSFWYQEHQYNYIYIPEAEAYELMLPFELYWVLSNMVVSYNDHRLSCWKFVMEEELHLKEVVGLHTEQKPMNVVEDHQGHLFIGYIDKIEKVKLGRPSTQHYLNNPNEKISTREITVSDNRDIYVTSYSGVYKIDDDSRVTNIIEDSNFYSILVQGDSLIWGVEFNKLYKVNLVSGKRGVYEIEGDCTILERKDEDHIWIGSSTGLYLFNEKSESYIDYSQFNEDTSITNNIVRNIIQMPDETLWIATGSGAYHFDPKKRNVVHYAENKGELSIPNNHLVDLYIDTNNEVWLGSTSGLTHIANGNKVKHYDMSDGLSDKIVCGILETDDALWLSTYNGFNRLDKATKHISSYFVSQEVYNNEFNHRSNLKLNDSILLFGGTNGVHKINAYELTGYNDTVSIGALSVKHYQKETDSIMEVMVPFHESREIRLDHKNNFFEVKFALNNTFNFEKDRYEYLIEGLDSDWVNLNNENTLRLYGIPPGSYTLRIRGYNDNGVRSANDIRYDLYVAEIFYKTPFFIISFIALLVGTVILVMYRQREKQKVKAFQKSQIKNLELKALRLQMNPHFIFSIINGMYSDLILKSETEANDYIVSFSRLLRATMDMTTQGTVSLQEEIDYLKSYVKLQEHRLDKNLSYSFHVTPKDAPFQSIKIPCMLFQPLVENAILHGLESKEKNRILKVAFHIENETVIGTVEDNGIGRAAAAKNQKKETYKTHALNIMSERIQINNELQQNNIQITTEDLMDGKKAKGTRVVVTINL